MSGSWALNTAIRTIFERAPLGPRLLFHPRSGRRGGGDARFVVTRLRCEGSDGRRGRYRAEVMRVNADNRKTYAIDAHDRHFEYPIETWHRPWPGRIRRFLTGRC